MITAWNKSKPAFKISAIVSLITILLFIAFAFDISPYLRGPVDNIIESRWPYYFVNTFPKAWVFIPIYLGYFLVIGYIYKIGKAKYSEWKMLAILVVLTFLFQLALVYFSRFGISILFRRLVDAGINGYFTESLRIGDLGNFFSNYPYLINERNFAQHASGHTPGAILLIRGFIDLVSFIPSYILSFLNNIQVGDAKDLWVSLTTHQRLAGITLPFILHFTASLIIIPFYFVVKEITKSNLIAMKTTLLYAVIPSLSFFALIFDPLYAFFPLISALLILVGVKKKQNRYFLFAGATCGIGLFFTAAMLTYIAGLIVYSIISSKTVLLQWIAQFISGILLVVLLLLIMNFNIFTSLVAVVNNQATREYIPWLIYNPYDFFVFLGIPISLVFIYQTFFAAKVGLDTDSVYGKLLLTFWITFISLIISGASRGEVGRIWLPFMFLPMILVGIFISKTKFSRYQFIIFFTLIFLQTIIMEEFWVPIW